MKAGRMKNMEVSDKIVAEQDKPPETEEQDELGTKEQEPEQTEYCKKSKYSISSVIRQTFFLPKQSKRSRSILKDGSRSLGLFRKGKPRIIAKFLRTDLVVFVFILQKGKPVL